MKKTISRLLILGTIILTVFVLNSCQKEVTSVPHTPAAGLMVFNLAPDQNAVGVSVSGNNFTNGPLAYTNFNGAYTSIYAGNHDVTYFNPTSDSTLATATQTFQDSGYYSSFFVGANSNYKNIIVRDNFDSLSSSSGQAYVRYINAIPDSTITPNVTVSANGANVFSDAAAFGNVSDFKGVTPGSISINVNAESAVNASRTISVDAGKIYTLLLIGEPSQTDTSKAVQIKYIQNGQLTK